MADGIFDHKSSFSYTTKSIHDLPGAATSGVAGAGCQLAMEFFELLITAFEEGPQGGILEITRLAP